MARWAELASAAPELAIHARERLHGRVSYLATIRKDGAPRVHPVTPVVSGEELYLFMEPTSPKGADLRRDPRYALHAGVEDNEGGGGEVIVTGTARQVGEPAHRTAAAAASAFPPEDRYILFVLEVEDLLATRYGESGPVRSRWRAERH